VDIGAGLSGEKRERENAGYYRSERFLYLLQSEVGLEAMQQANAALASSGEAADSRRFMDAIEEASGRNNDALFLEWVFPASFSTTLGERREVRDRLTTLIARAQEEGLSDRVPGEIERDVAAWDFENAREALEVKEQEFREYLELRDDLSALREGADAAGLSVAQGLETTLDDWEFERAATMILEAEEALSRYIAAREKIEEPRGLWERFGLLGSDPEGELEEAAKAFNEGDYERAGDRASDAMDAVDSASSRAARRVLLVAGGAGVFALLILLIVWYSNRRDEELAD
jgi:hypothetical protein